MKLYKVVIYVPASHADSIRRILAEQGAGHIGNYDSCSFSVKGIGRFRPLEKAKPYIGKPGQVEMVEEERIETVVSSEKLTQVYSHILNAHPYEEPAIDVYELKEVKSNPKKRKDQDEILCRHPKKICKKLNVN